MATNIFGAGIQSRSRVVTAQRRINAHYEYHPLDADRTKVSIWCRGGLRRKALLSGNPTRCLFPSGDYLHVVCGAKCFQVRKDFTSIVLGSLDTTDGIVTACENATQILLTDGYAGYVITKATGAFAKITDPDMPSAPGPAAFANNYGVIPRGDTGQFFITDLGDFTSVDALDFSTADSSPDDVLAVYEYQGMVGLFGEQSIEFWGFTGGADFPFARVSGSKEDWGLAAKHSLAPFGQDLIALCRNTVGGEAAVCIVGNTGVQPVTPPDLIHKINPKPDNPTAYTRVDDAVGSAFQVNGHLMYMIRFPTADATWVFDQATGIWSEYLAWDGGGFPAHLCCSFNGRTIVGGVDNGALYALDPDKYTDDDANGTAHPLPMELWSRELGDQATYTTLRSLELLVEAGNGITGTGQGSDPQWMLRVSKDRGYRFGKELWRKSGKKGERKARVRWNGLGAGRSLMVRLRITDPIFRVITGENVDLGAA